MGLNMWHPKAHESENISSTGWSMREYVSSIKAKRGPALRCLSDSPFSLVGLQKGLKLGKISRGWCCLFHHLLGLTLCGSLDGEDKMPLEDSQVIWPSSLFPSMFVPSVSTLDGKSTPSDTERNSHARSPSSTYQIPAHTRLTERTYQNAVINTDILYLIPSYHPPQPASKYTRLFVYLKAFSLLKHNKQVFENPRLT